MARRHRQHVNPLSQTKLVARDALVIPDGPTVEIELGCGDGLFLVERSQSMPNHLLLGLDIRPEFLQPGLKRIAELELTTVRLETCNLIVDIGHLFPPDRVDTFWINFPDPWFKQRQKNRRWLDKDAVPHLVDALKPGGRIVYQSDVWEPTLDALAFFEATDRLLNKAGSFTFYKQRIATEMTSRERGCEREEKPIWRLWFERVK